MSVRIIQGDCRVALAEIPDASVHCCVTSPPYWGLRDYGTGTWQGGDAKCSHKLGRNGAGRADGVVDERGQRNRDGVNALTQRVCPRCGARRIDKQIGLEPTPEEYVASLVEIFRQVRRVLRKDGTLWLNMGDSYFAGNHSDRSDSRRDEFSPLQDGNRAATFEGSPTRRGPVPGLKPKDLCGIPWRVALALQRDGWWLRSDIIWNKNNPMPESVTDRPTVNHEYLFLLAKTARYFYDTEAIKEKCQSNASDIKKMQQGKERIGGRSLTDDQPLHKANSSTNIGRKRGVGGTRIHGNIPGRDDAGAACNEPGQLYRNKRTVWTIGTEAYKGAHFATFPRALVRPCILAGTSQRGACSTCGAPWSRILKRGAYGDWRGNDRTTDLAESNRKHADKYHEYEPPRTTGWQTTCECNDSHILPCTVLDPFAGSGTVGEVAEEEGRNSILIELNPDYITLIKKRTAQRGLFASADGPHTTGGGG